MRSERGQATVEWIAIVVVVVAIGLAAAGRFARRDEDRGLATTLLHSVTCAARQGCAQKHVVAMRSGKRNESQPPGLKAFTAPALVPDPPRAQDRQGPGAGSAVRSLLDWVGRATGRGLAGRRRRGPPGRLRQRAGRAWRSAWFACLVYERARWAVLHPESRSHEYELPPSEALRMVNDCISPVDLIRDWPMPSGR